MTNRRTFFTRAAAVAAALPGGSRLMAALAAKSKIGRAHV